MKLLKKNILHPPQEMSFYELFDYFWDNGIGNFLDENGNPQKWDSKSLSIELENHNIKAVERAIDDWKSHYALLQQRYVRGLALIASDGDEFLLKKWNDALWQTRREEDLSRKEKRKQRKDADSPIPPKDKLINSIDQISKIDNEHEIQDRVNNKKLWIIVLITILISTSTLTYFWYRNTIPSVENIRICDKFRFNKDTEKCDEHVSVFVHGIDDVYLSFDFKNVPENTAFERWWIHNSERVAGRSSFNDVAWPGWTFWRPGKLKIGQYVVRIVVDSQVFTQTFYVQKDGFYEHK